MSIGTGVAAAVGALLISSPAIAQTAPLPIVASNFVFVPGAGAVANSVCAPGLNGAAQLGTTLSTLLTELGLDPQLVVVLTTQPLICGDLFYHPLANDVRGIGYQHEPSGELFDQTPDSRLEGMAFLNDFPYWQAHPAEFQNDFDHEVGHRWGARVHAMIDGVDSAELLGRDQEHWSYFLNSGGSPLEGNSWTDLGHGQYVAETALGPGRFSDLDLYAMGVLPASQVAPRLLLRPATAATTTDCLGQPLKATSPPQSCGPYQTQATPVTFGIADVIAVEGERDPPAVATPISVDVAVVVLGTGAQPLDPSECQALAEAVPARIADFATATGGSVLLNNLVTAGADCVSFAQQPSSPMSSGGCAAAPGEVSQAGPIVALLGLAFCRRRRVSPSS